MNSVENEMKRVEESMKSTERHLRDHAYDMVLSTYKRINTGGPVSNMTVNREKCGTVVVELYNGERAEETIADFERRWGKGAVKRSLEADRK
jgi:hypothetical protein